MAGSVTKGWALQASTDRFKGYRQMMGAIVLSMLLGWFGAVAVLTVLSGGNEDAAVAEESARTAGAPRLAADDSQTSRGA
jgi:hypothetical protein